jgi:hypothetical protein
MPDDRFQRWVDASSAAGAVEAFMVPLVQGLGRFDCHLINEDARSAALNQEQSTSLHESTRLADSHGTSPGHVHQPAGAI